jgi:hypothetical protein
LIALITASLPLIVVVTPGMSASGTESHFGIIELFDVSGEILRFCADGDCQSVVINEWSHRLNDSIQRHTDAIALTSESAVDGVGNGIISVNSGVH